MPTPVALSTISRGASLTQLCCCLNPKCCPCINVAFLKTQEGLIKIAEVVLGSACQNLLMSYGLMYILTLGSSFYSFITVSSACMMTSFILLLCYVIAPNSVHILRSSLFESLFNVFGALLYLSSACYLAFATHTYLYPIEKLVSIFELFSVMSTTYSLGFALSGIHAYDAYLAYNT